MSINEINIKIETLKEWEAIAAEASAMVESIKDEIKRHMDAQGLEELEAGTHIVRYTTVLSNRFDSSLLVSSLFRLSLSNDLITSVSPRRSRALLRAV